MITLQDVLAADALILGAPGRQGGMCGEMRMFLDSLADLQGPGTPRGLKVRCSHAVNGSARKSVLIATPLLAVEWRHLTAGQGGQCIHQCRWEAARLWGP